MQKCELHYLLLNSISSLSVRNEIYKLIFGIIKQARVDPWLHLWKVQKKEMLFIKRNYETPWSLHLLVTNVFKLSQAKENKTLNEVWRVHRSVRFYFRRYLRLHFKWKLHLFIVSCCSPWRNNNGRSLCSFCKERRLKMV